MKSCEQNKRGLSYAYHEGIVESDGYNKTIINLI
jgi:hypothetical protein